MARINYFYDAATSYIEYTTVFDNETIYLGEN